MKLVHSLAILAVFLLVSQNVASAASWGWLPGISNNGDAQKANLEAKAIDPMIKDEEMEADGDYDQDSIPVVKELNGQAGLGGEEVKTKIQIPDDQDDGTLTDIKTINELPSQSPYNGTAHDEYPVYDRTPQQSEFLDPAPHPTESQGRDPRFDARPRQCGPGQYLCRKAHPTQEHVRCIPDSWKCNGVRECEENDDEENCPITPHRPSPNGCIHPYQYTCGNTGVNGIPAMCISADKLCDGNYDCVYGDDETADRCQAHQYARRREESVARPGVEDLAIQQPQQPAQPVANGPNVQQAPPTYNPYDQPQPHQVQPQPQYQPQPAPQQPPQQCNGGKSEEYVKRLEWLDRCFRSCIGRQ